MFRHTPDTPPSCPHLANFPHHRYSVPAFVLYFPKQRHDPKGARSIKHRWFVGIIREHRSHRPHTFVAVSQNLMFKQLINQVKQWSPAEAVSAHCDGPCGVYDPASARVTAEAVLSMTKKIIDLNAGAGDTATANTLSRYISIKEKQAHETKEHILVLWTDYFKPVHLEQFPNLHDTIWKATKLCSACKVEVSLQHAEELMAAVEEIHNIFWATKGREVAFVKAS